LKLPALRERGGDIILLAQDFLEKQAAVAKTRPKSLSVSALGQLLSHSWPGNVRELQNVLLRVMVLSDSDFIEASDLNLPGDRLIGDEQSFRAMKSRAIRRFERELLTTLLRAHGGNISRAAFAAKKNRRAVWELLRKHGMLARHEGRLTATQTT
jgi:two-component system response regulator GlrR